MKTKKLNDDSFSSASSAKLKKPIVNLTNFSTNVVGEINKLREHPSNYAKKLLDAVRFTNDEELEYHGMTIKLSEKKDSFLEAIDLLQKNLKCPKLLIKEGIIKCAEDLMKVLILHDGIENTETFNTNCHFQKRMNKYGCALGELDELIDIGSASPEIVVLNFLLCDGDPSRRERKILFNDKMNFVGFSSEILPCEKYCTVINLAEHYYDVGEDIPDMLLREYYPDVFKKLDQDKRRKSIEEQERERTVKLNHTGYLSNHHTLPVYEKPNLNMSYNSNHHNHTVNVMMKSPNNNAKLASPNPRIQGNVISKSPQMYLNNNVTISSPVKLNQSVGISSPSNNNQNISTRKSGVIKLAGGKGEEEEEEEVEKDEIQEEENEGDEGDLLEMDYLDEVENEDEEFEEIKNKDIIVKTVDPEIINKYYNSQGMIPLKIVKAPVKKSKEEAKKKKKKSFDEDAEEILDDNILKVNIVEKEVVDEKTQVKRVLINKKIMFKDGTTQSIVYTKGAKK